MNEHHHHPSVRHRHVITYDRNARPARWCPYCHLPSVLVWNAIVVARCEPLMPVWSGRYYWCENCGDMGYEQGADAGVVVGE